MTTSNKRPHRVAVIPGDGIGLEVTRAALIVLHTAAAAFGLRMQTDDFDWGCEHYLKTGSMMPEDGLSILSEYDAILLGAVGDPTVPDHVSLWGLLIPIRRAFEQYVNLRPVRLLPNMKSPLRDRGEGDIDLVIVRENTEGEYSQLGGRHGRGIDEFAIQSAVFTGRGTRRIMEYALNLSYDRRKQVTSATKSNGLVHSMPFWDEIFAQVVARHPEIRTDSCHVDALAARLILQPDTVDVVVASNLFGDILSDVAAAIVGGLGVAPAGNINPERTYPSMFEAVHGSAPDIAGKGVANPVAQILASALMLRHLGEEDVAEAIESSVTGALADGVLTRDAGGVKGTFEVAEAVAERLAYTYPRV